MLVIEPARPDEVDKLIRLAADTLAADIDSDWLAEAAVADVCIVARNASSNDVVGFALARREETCRAHLLALAVEPEQRHTGIGAALLRRVEEEMTRAGALNLHLEVRYENTQAQSFYARHGFSPEGLQSHAYPDGADAVSLVRPL